MSHPFLQVTRIWKWPRNSTTCMARRFGSSHGHDLLAAVWRFRNDFQQPLLPFVDKKSLDELQTLWLGWLRHEIAGWIDYPHRVRLVQLILTNQNELPGYIAEAQLSLDIINWFTEVPWNQTLREASEASLSEHRKKLSRCGRDGLGPLE